MLRALLLERRASIREAAILGCRRQSAAVCLWSSQPHVTECSPRTAEMKAIYILSLFFIHQVAAQTLVAPLPAESMSIPAQLPCCEDMPAMSSLGMLSQSVVSRSRARYALPYE